MVWRLIRHDGVSAAAGLACDEALAERAGTGLSPTTLRLYTYRPHVALVGRFQNAATELHLSYFEDTGIQINRRPTGGGAIIMGPDQLGIALALRGRGQPMRARELMSRFSKGLLNALQGLGIKAAFRGKNDLEVRGRKIAGLGVYRDASGGLLFHASLLVDLDVPLMARVLALPFAQDQDLAALSARTCTVRRLLGRDIAMEEVRALVVQGFSEGFDTAVEPGELDAAETAAVASLERAKYRTEAWVFQRTQIPDTAGSATVRTPGGAIDVRIALAGRMIKAAYLRGDFFEDEATIADLEGRLRWHSSELAAVDATVRRWRDEHAEGTVDAEALTNAIVSAAHGGAPYGCFVSPGRSAASG